MATASGPSSAMYSFRASRRSATAGRPKCRSEICARVVTNCDSTRIRLSSKPQEHCSRSVDPQPTLLDGLQELRKGSVELLGGFEVRKMAGLGNGLVACVWHLRGHGAHDFGRSDTIFLPADDECGDAYLAEEGGRVGALPHGAEGGDHTVGGSIEDHGADPLGEEPHAFEGYVAAHGDAAEDHAFQMQPIQESTDPFRIEVDIGLGRSAG